MSVEYLDPSIANEGMSANNWEPGVWANSVALSDDEWQPDIEPPRIPDYAAFKKHKHYGRYFRAYRYQPFPAFMYHPVHEPKLIDVRFRDGNIDDAECKKAVIRLGQDWQREPFPKDQMKALAKTGKASPVKNDTQRLTEALVAGLAENQVKAGGTVDANLIAATVAAVMAAMTQRSDPKVIAQPNVKESIDPHSEEVSVSEGVSVSEDVERKALTELAEKEGIKVDGRWSNQRLKKELGLD